LSICILIYITEPYFLQENKYPMLKVIPLFFPLTFSAVPPISTGRFFGNLSDRRLVRCNIKE
jgi:hypothetical protein